MKKITSVLCAAMLAGTTLAAGPAAALDDKQKEEIGAFIKEYLVANPEILLEVQDALEAKQEEAKRLQASAAIEENQAKIFNASGDISLGNPDGDVTVVEFFDYNCGYCKRAMQDMDAIIADDPQVRFVLKEFPILGPDSIAAHTVSMAFRMIAPEKYGEFHRELLGGEGRANGDRAIEIATSLGVDEAELRAKMKDPSIEASVNEAYGLANSLGISGTPSYVVGDAAVFGALGASALEQKIANMRSCDSTVC